jgi:hypothetical protein
MDGGELSLGQAGTAAASGERARATAPQGPRLGAQAPANNRLSVARCGHLWAVKHNDGFLGYAASEAEAWSIAHHLADAAIGRTIG